MAPLATVLRCLFHVADVLARLTSLLLQVTLQLACGIAGDFADGFVDLTFAFSATPFAWSLFIVISCPSDDMSQPAPSMRYT